jgi:hypothetical protein
VGASSSGVKVSPLLGLVLLSLLFPHLFLDNCLDLCFSNLGFFSDLLQVVCWVVTLAVQVVFSLHKLLGPKSVDSVGRVVEHLVSCDWFFEVQVSLWDVLLNDGSIYVTKDKVSNSIRIF